MLCDEHHEGTWRVTTKGYAYKLTDAARAEVWALHSHPVGHSPVTSPMPTCQR